MCDFFSDLRAMYDVTNKNPYIAETLLHAGLIGEEEARAAEAEAGARGIGLLDCLADGGRNKAELFAALAARAGMEAVSLDPATPPPVAAQLVPAEVALRYRVVPLRRSGGILAVAVGDPFDLETLDTLRYILKDVITSYSIHYTKLYDVHPVRPAGASAGSAGSSASSARRAPRGRFPP